jgi:iron complex transport system substrate-binding protein
MRIASLVPSATEILAALEVDGEVVEAYELDEDGLAGLSPDLVVDHDPSTLGEMLEDVVRIGEAVGRVAAARELRGELEGRLAAVRAAVSGAPAPRVIALEWLDPPFVGGHWIPEMISIAGGEDVAGPPGLKPPEVSWGALSGLVPDVVIAMPRGRDIEESRAQALEHRGRIAGLGAGRVYAVDASSTFSRPGPRLVDGVELLGHLLHPDLVDPPGNIGFAAVRAVAPRRS